MIANWHRAYTEGGTAALEKPVGRPPKMTKKPTKKSLHQRQKSTNQTEVKRLHQEIDYLRIKNAYLKKLKELGLIDHRDPNKPNSHSILKKEGFKLNTILKVIELPESSYHYHKQRLNKVNLDEALEKEFKQIFDESVSIDFPGLGFRGMVTLYFPA